MCHFRSLGQKSKNNFVRFLVQMRTRKFAFDIYWPLQLLCSKWQKRSRRVQAAYYETTCLVWVGIGRGQKNKQMWLPKIIYSSIYLLMQKASHLFWMATQYKQGKKRSTRCHNDEGWRNRVGKVGIFLPIQLWETPSSCEVWGILKSLRNFKDLVSSTIQLLS